jgi:hypothetical protein
MTDHLDSVEEPSAAELAAIDALLAPPDVWDDPPDGIDDLVVSAIEAERGPVALPSGPVIALDERRAWRTRSATPKWLAAAAVCAAVVAGLALVTRGGSGADDIRIALAGTDAAPGASADVTLAATPAGLKILLDADGLEPAPDGYFYEAWVSNGSIRVSAGSFHVRNGDGPIELWAGVVDPDFTSLAVTLEPIDGDTDSSGDVRLSGQYQLTGG